MSLQITQQADISLVGDGVSTVFSYDITQPPFSSALYLVPQPFVVGSPTSVYLGGNAPQFGAQLGQFSQANLGGWSAGNGLLLSFFLVDSNNYIQRVTTSGVTGTTMPAFSSTVGNTTNDGTVVWTNVGQYNSTLVNNTGFISGTASLSGTVLTLTFASPLLAGLPEQAPAGGYIWIDPSSGISYTYQPPYVVIVWLVYNSYS